MKNIFRSRRNKKPHKNEEQKENKEAPFFSKDGTSDQKAPFFPANNLVQTKLNIGQPGDKYEQEADSVANQVVSNSNNTPAIQNKGISDIQRTTLATPAEDEKLSTAEGRMEKDKLIQEKSEEEEPVQTKEMEEEAVQKMEEEEPLQAKEEEEPLQMKEEEEPLQMMEEEEAVQAKEEMINKEEEEEPAPMDLQKKATANNSNAKTASPKLSQKIKNKSGKGRKMSDATRTEMESGIGADFSGVNIHTDQEAAELNKSLGAQAFTNGNDVYFNDGKYNPENAAGKRLLAHELTHVVQQGGGEKIQKQPVAKASKPNKKDAVINWQIGSLNINQAIKNRIFSASNAFSLSQLERMKKAGVRFWHKGQTPDYLKNLKVKIVLNTPGGKANYIPQGRTIGVDSGSKTSHIKHEIAHAWDHVINLSGGKLKRIEKMSEKQLTREIKAKKPFRSQNSKKIKSAFKEYKKNVGGPDGKFSGEERRNYAFDGPSTKEGYSLTKIYEFYAEGYSVFHGPHVDKKKRLLENAPKLHRFLTKEAKRNK